MASLRSPFPSTRRGGPYKPILWQEVAAQHFSFYGVAFSVQAHRPHHKNKRCREIDTFLSFNGLRKLGIEHRCARLSLPLAVGPLQTDSFGKKLLRNTFLFMVFPSVCKPTGHTIKTKGVDFSTPSFLLIGLWELRDSNPRPSACKADALNQLS